MTCRTLVIATLVLLVGAPLALAQITASGDAAAGQNGNRSASSRS